MPVRFRCAYCNQLLGISRRKAGTIVRCPTCSGQVVVPSVESVPAAVQQPVFERSDFEELFGDTGGNGSRAVESSPPAPMPAAPPAGSWGTHAEPAFDVEKLDPSTQHKVLTPSAGFVLSPTLATILAVLGILALGVAFAAGVVVGKFVLGS
jgi:DNA-directed RNA polymerase subunit RPC12/RpoP